MKFWEMVKLNWNATRDTFSAWAFLMELNFGAWIYDRFIDPGNVEHYIDFELRVWAESQRDKEIKNEIDELVSDIEKGN